MTAASVSLPEPDATGFDSPGDRAQRRAPTHWQWQAGHFSILARADAVDIAYDFAGRMGEVDLACYAPEQTRELAAALLAAAERAEQAARRNRLHRG